MCLFGGNSKQQVPAPTPAPAPTAAPVPSEVSPATEESKRQREAERLKKGLAATIKTGPQGITGQGPDLKSPSAASVLYGGPPRKKIGA